jgi:hypothetical protein
MPQFIVIPRDRTGQFDDLSPDEMQQLVERYHAWTMRLAEQGRMSLGHKLRDDEGRVLRPGEPGAPMSVTNGPFAEGREVIGGFWIINADDLDDAVTTIADCPHLESGSLEVREIEVIPDS